MNRALMLLVAMPIIALTASCEQSPAQKDQGNTSPAVAQPAIADEDLAVPADFEDEASKTITASNFKTELDKLETEIVN